MEDREAQRLLSPLRELAPAGPGSVDVDRAVRRGRRVSRVRIAASALGAVIVLVAGASVVPALWHRDAPTAAPGEFSVLRQEFSVGAAAGYTPTDYTTGRYRQSATLWSGKKWVSVLFYAVGHPPTPGWSPRGELTEPVSRDQQPATYLADPVLQPGNTELAWQWAPDGWAIVDVPAGTSDARSVARQVAERTGARYAAAVRTPFTITAPPHGWHVIGVATGNWPGAAGMPTVEVLLGDSDVPRPLDAVGPEARLIVAVGRADDIGGEHMRTLGKGLVATATGELPDAQLRHVLDSVRLSVGPDPTDIAHWAANPIR